MSGSQLQLQVLVSPTIDLTTGGTFSPTTATIISGPTEVVVVDTLYAIDDVKRLGDAIEATGKRLKAVYVTHAHFDHYFGLGELLKRFPEARGLALAPVVELVREGLDQDKVIATSWMPGKTVDPTALPEALDGRTISVDGHELHAIEVGQGDVAHSTVLHVPSLDAVVAGDVVYNGVHQMLGTSGPADWPNWITSVGKIEDLEPKIVIAGHKKPDAADDDVAAILGGTREYIGAFIELYNTAPDAETLIAGMSERYSDRINLATLQYSAATAIEARNAAGAV